MSVPTTYAPTCIGAPTELLRLPSLREREFDGICDALADGALVVIARTTRGFAAVPTAEIIGALAPDDADEFVRLTEEGPARERQAGAIGEQLRELREELATLRTIVGEVMAEKRPQDFDHRIGACIDDADALAKGAIDMAEEL